MVLKIYLASRFTSRKRLVEIRQLLLDKGLEVTSRWLNDSDNRPTFGTEAWADHSKPRAIMDVEDVTSADVIILDLLDGPGTRSGQWVELGIGLGQNKPCIVVGETDNTFTFHPLVERVSSWSKCLTKLQSLKQVEP